MKIVHSFHRFFPEDCGGIQIHLNELIPYLKSRGIAGKVAAAIDGSQPRTYIFNDIEVFRYPTFPEPPPEPNHGAFTHGNFHLFREWLAREKPDVYHQHQWTPRCGLEHLKAAKRLGIKTIVTLHLPESICLRRTLMFEGKTACNGRISAAKCSKCVDSYAQQLPDSILALFSNLPTKLISQLPLPKNAYSDRPVRNKKSALVRPVVLPIFAKERLESLQQLSEFADRIVVVADWLKQALLMNDLPEHKIRICKCGIQAPGKTQLNLGYGTRKNKPLKIAFLGRWHETKGIHILIEALKLIPAEVSIKLYIHGIRQDERYRQKLVQEAQRDERLQISPQIPRHEVSSTLAQYDVLAVPSQWLETGPLVVPEAHAVGLPIVGSNLGGIAERIHNNVDGILVQPDDPKAWANAFIELACNPSFLQKLKQGIGPIRTIEMEAEDLAQIYGELDPRHRSPVLNSEIQKRTVNKDEILVNAH